MIKQLQPLLATGILLWATGCAMTPAPLVLAPVGPNPTPRPQAGTDGTLKVYTAVKRYAYEPTTYVAYTAYSVYDANGYRIKSVQNSKDFYEPMPQTVTLPAGTYTIQAWAEGLIFVKVPVVIQPGRLTIVNLEIGNQNLFKKAKPEELVRMPDGRLVGWSANEPASR